MYRANETSQEVLAELGFAEAVVKATVLRVVEQGVNGVNKKSVKRERKAYGLLQDLGFHRTLLFPDIVLPGKGGRGSDPLYMTMPFCDCDLTKFDFENGGQVIELMTALADGVGHLHEHGIAHFDIKGENVHRDFRIWMTSYPSPIFPITVLENGVKITSEAPSAFRSALLRLYESDPVNDPQFFAECSKPAVWRTMLFGLCFFHCSIRQRRSYGPIGYAPVESASPARVWGVAR